MKSLLIALLLLFNPAQDKGRVVKLLRETIAIYDADGNPVGRDPKWDLPGKGAPIIGSNAKGHIGIKRGDRIVYLRNSEILTEGVAIPCAKGSSAARPSGKVSSASEGIGSGMSNSSAACVR